MLNKIIDFSVKNKLMVGLMVIAMALLGIYQATKLPIDAVPDITNNQVQVITIAPSFGATDIERLVTFPIEQANSNIPGMMEIRSFSRFGLSLVTLVFDDATDVYWARQQVAERLQMIQSQIPQGIGQPELGPVTTGLGEIFQYVVRAKKGYEQRYSSTELRTIQDWIVRRQLLGVEGVAEVSSFGGKLKQYEVAVSPDKLNAYGVTIQDVFSALEQNNQNTGGAYIEKGPTVQYIRSEGLIGTIDDIRNIALPSRKDNLPVFIRDVAEVGYGSSTRYGAMCYNNQGEVAGAIVMMLKGANSSEVIKRVKERVAKIQQTLPEGVMIEPFLDRTKMVNHAISTVEKNLLEGALIVVFVLVLFLGNFRAGLLVASVIPLSMLFAITMMNAFGVGGNLMSLGALDFGLIVDGAVIIVEAVMHQLAHNTKFRSVLKLDTNQMDETVSTSAGRMMNSAVFGQIIILIVYLPIFSLQGIEGKMFKPMAQTVAFALLGAFLLSLTYIPMMSALFLSKKVKHTPNFSDRMMHWVEAGYHRAILKILNRPKWIIGSVLVLFVLSLGILSRLGGEFIPTLEEGDFAVDTRVLTGSNLNTTIEYTQKAAGILTSRFPEVEKVVTKIGSGEVPTDPMPMEASDMMVILKDKEDWISAKTFDELAAKMQEALKEVPGITAGFQYPVQMRFNELMTGARQDVVCKIFGENMDTLATYADKLGHIVSTVKGAQNIFVEPVTGMPQIVIEYNRDLIARYGLSVAEINRVVNTALAGQSTGLVFEDEKRFDLVVRLKNDRRRNIDDVQNMLIPTRDGLQIPLSQLASVQVKDGPNQIQREDAKRRIVVGFNIAGRDVQSIVQELQGKVSTTLKLPSGYYVVYGGAFENLNQAKQRLMIAVPVSLILIFLLLYFAFNSVKHSLLIYTAIPLSAIGGIFSLFLRGMPFSISAGVGFIALFGVAVLNGIVLVAEFNRLREQGLDNLTRIVIRGARLRLRPVLMTAFVASMGFLPMALSHGSGAEVQRPLATVVIGGLMLATFLTLFLLPLLYIMFENVKPREKGRVIFPLLFVMALFAAVEVKAQSNITLQQAYQRAAQHNLGLKNEWRKVEADKLMIASFKEVPRTQFVLDAGQVNSALFDTKFGVSQSVPLPSFFRAQKNLLSEQWHASQVQVELLAYELRRTVTDIFCRYDYLLKKQEILRRADSLYNGFFERARLRLQKGESNVLEKITAETQKKNAEQQLALVAQEMQSVLWELAYLLHSDTLFVPSLESTWGEGLLSPQADSNLMAAHPKLQVLMQEFRLAQAQSAVEKSKLLPELMLGYNNNSFRGIGPDNKSYTMGNRFHSVQAGIGIPLFARSQKTKLEVARVREEIVLQSVELGKEEFQTRIRQYMAAYENQRTILRSMQQSSLPNAQLILQTAGKQFFNGEINYLDYVLLVNQALALQNAYADAQYTLNNHLIQLQFINLN